MTDRTEFLEHLAAARAALASDDPSAARAPLTEAAQLEPLDDELHELLDSFCSEEAPDPRDVKLLQSEKLGPLVDVWERVGRRRLPVFGLLPALGRVEESLLELRCPPLNEPRGREADRKERFDLAIVLAGWMPVHKPVYDGFTTYSPTRATIQDGVLRMEQLSRYHHKPWDIGNERIYFVAYRVRGLLLHARWYRFYHWSSR